MALSPTTWTSLLRGAPSSADSEIDIAPARRSLLVRRGEGLVDHPLVLARIGPARFPFGRVLVNRIADMAPRSSRSFPSSMSCTISTTPTRPVPGAAAALAHGPSELELVVLAPAEVLVSGAEPHATGRG